MRALPLMIMLPALVACDPAVEAPNIVRNEATAAPAPAPDDKAAVTAFLREQMADFIGDSPLNVETGRADLDGDGSEEILAYAMGPMVCGSGGCGLYVLSEAGSSYRILDELTVSHLPVYQLPAGADGWAELGVTVYGGGMSEAVMAVPHDASGYADNPTVQPAYKVDPGDAPVIIAEPPLP